MPTPLEAPSQTRSPGLTFVHVSDIHFHFRRNGSILDRDADIAHQLVLDASRLTTELTGCDGILVNGDLAYNGKEDEYVLAHSWLQQLCDGIRCDPLAIWLVPGNHDVERPASAAIRDTLIRNLRSPASEKRINDFLRGYLEGDDGENVLFRCLQKYNEFAGGYECPVSAKKPSWSKDLPLNDGSTLRLSGLTSVITSNGDDDDRANKLALGEFQVANLREDPRIAHMVMCHHPMNWLLDASEVEPQVNARARVQLFGHEHRQQIDTINNSLRIVAGAVTPSRDEDHWEPRYNVLQIAVLKTTSRQLVIKVHPRAWDSTQRKFVEASGGAIREYKLALPDWNPPMSEESPASKIATSETESAAPNADSLLAVTSARITMSPERRLTYRFFQLPYAVRMEIVARLGLISDQDQGVTDPELTRRFFERARQRRLLDQLWDELKIRLGLPDEQNPYREAGRVGGPDA